MSCGSKKRVRWVERRWGEKRAREATLTHTICTFPSLSVNEGSVALSRGGEKATGRLEFLDHPRQGLEQPLFLLVTSRLGSACSLQGCAHGFQQPFLLLHLPALPTPASSSPHHTPAALNGQLMLMYSLCLLCDNPLLLRLPSWSPETKPHTSSLENFNLIFKGIYGMVCLNAVQNTGPLHCLPIPRSKGTQYIQASWIIHCNFILNHDGQIA